MVEKNDFMGLFLVKLNGFLRENPYTDYTPLTGSAQKPIKPQFQ
jgi:hypothetical protein